MALTSEQSALAGKLSLDLSKIDWTKVVALIQLLISIFGLQGARAALKAAGCPDDHLDACCACHEAGLLALQSAQVSFNCCADKCGG